MKPLPKKNDTVSVYGLGRSGRALVAHLVAKGVRVCAFDDKPREALGDTPLWLSSLGVPLYAGGEGEARGDFVFRTPAMRPDSPVLCRAALHADEDAKRNDARPSGFAPSAVCARYGDGTPLSHRGEKRGKHAAV